MGDPSNLFTNAGAGPVSFGGLTLPPGSSFGFDDVCALTEFIAGSGAQVFETGPGGAADALNARAAAAGCSHRVTGVAVPPNPAVDESPLRAGESDGAVRTGLTDGADPSEVVEVSAPTGGSPGEDPRPPEQQVYSPLGPLAAGDLHQVMIDRGATDDEAANVVDRALRGLPQVGLPHVGLGGDRTTTRAVGADPVDLFDGAFTIAATDLDVPTPFVPLRLDRVYRSGPPLTGPLGFNWDHGWNVFLRELADSSVARWNGTLHEDVFTPTGAGSFEPPRGVPELLRRTAGGYEILGVGGSVTTFEVPPGWPDIERIPLRRVADRCGNGVDVGYDDEGRVATVVDDDGRGLFFDYGDCGFLEHVADHTGRRVDYVHDDDATHLVGVVLPHEATGDLAPVQRSAAETVYRYDDLAAHPARRHAIVAVEDGTGVELVRSEYGDDPSDWGFNRVVRQVAAGWEWRFCYQQVQWVAPLTENLGTVVWRTEVTAPDGGLSIWSFSFRGDLLEERQRLAADGSFRVAVSSREYDEQGNLAVLSDPDGVRTLTTFDAANPDPRLRWTPLQTELHAPSGIPVTPRVVRRTRWEPRFQRPVEERDEAGNLTTYDYDPVQGHLLAVRLPPTTAPDGVVGAAVTRFETGSRGQVTAVTTPAGLRHEAHYDPGPGPGAGFLTTTTSDVGGVGARSSFTRDAVGWVVGIADGSGNDVLVDLDAQGRPVRWSGPLVDGVRPEVRITRDTRGRVVQVVAPDGVQCCERDDWGRVTAIEVAADSADPWRLDLSLDHTGQPVRVQDARGVVTRWCHDERGLLLRQVVGDGTPLAVTTLVTRTRGGAVTRVSTAGRIEEFGRDVWGRPDLVTRADGSRLVRHYGPDDDLVATELLGTPGGSAPQRVLRRDSVLHDERHRAVRRCRAVFTDDPDAATELCTRTWFDADDRPLRVVVPGGGELLRTFDGLGRLVSTTSPGGDRVEQEFGPYGAWTAVRTTLRSTDATTPDLVLEQRTEFDPIGRPLATTSGTGARTEFGWDPAGRLVRVRDAAGCVVALDHDAHGQVERRTVDPDGAASAETLRRSTGGRLEAVVEASGHVTDLRHDVLGRTTALGEDGTAVVGTEFDGRGRVRAVRPGDGSVVEFSYDAVDRLVRRVVVPAAGTGAVPAVEYVWDGADRLVAARSDGLEWRFEYDSLDRLVAEHAPTGTVRREHDDAARWMRTIWPSGRVERANWDTSGRVDRVELLAVDGALPVGKVGDLLAAVEFLGPGFPTRVALVDGSATRFGYDDAGRVHELEHAGSVGPPVRSRFGYDAAGRRRVDEVSGGWPGDRRTRRVDLALDGRAGGVLTGLGPLPPVGTSALQAVAISDAEAQVGTSELTLVLDASGARTAVGGNPLPRGPGYALTGLDGVTVTHDAAGRRTSDGRRRVLYDALGRVVRVTPSGGTPTTVGYDALDRVAEIATGSEVHRYIRLGERVLTVADGAGNPRWHRTVHPGFLHPLLHSGSEGTVGAHADLHGDVVLTTDATGKPLDVLRYDADGGVRIHRPADGAVRTTTAAGIPPVFGGMPLLGDTGLFWTPARLYDPGTGLFLARDPAHPGDSPDPYAYCDGHPLDELDPDGDLAIVALLVLAGVGALVAGSITWQHGGDSADIAVAAVLGGIAAAGGAAAFALVATEATAALLGMGFGDTAFGAIAISFVGPATGGAVAGSMENEITVGGQSAWQAYRAGDDPGEAFLEAAPDAAVSGAVGGFVTNGFLGVGLRSGAIPSAGPRAPFRKSATGWTAFMDATVPAGGGPSRRAAMMPGVLGRGAAGPWGLGPPAVHFAQGAADAGLRGYLAGEDWDAVQSDALDAGEWSAVAAVGTTALHPSGIRFWQTRLSRRAGDEAYRSKLSATPSHHQRNAAGYPEFAYPVPRDPKGRGPLWWRLTNSFARDNVSGRFSDFQTQEQHRRWHLQQDVGGVMGPGRWTQVPTHGPFQPMWNPLPGALNPRAGPRAVDKPAR